MGGSHCIYARLKDTERYVLVSEVPRGSMDSFKHHVVAYTMDRKHQNKKSLYLYKGYLRLAKAIVRGKYLEITFNSTEAASGWDISEEKLCEIPWLFRDFDRAWKPVSVEYSYMRVYQKI